MKLRNLGVAVVAAMALFAGRAEAQDAGWDSKYGVLFTIPNLFQNGSSQLMDDYNGLIGVQMNLGPQRALRFSAALSRFSEGLTKGTDALGNDYEDVPPITSQYGVNLGAELLMRATTSAISPYFGVGAFLDYGSSARKGEDTYDGTMTAEYDWVGRGFDFGAVGKLGLEWRIHKAVAFFAEYQATLTLLGGTTYKDDIADTEESEFHFINLDTGIAQGGQLGIVAFF